jgi:hypothetical protein
MSNYQSPIGSLLSPPPISSMLIVPLHKKRASESEAHALLPCSPSHRIQLGNTMHLIGGWTTGPSFLVSPLLLPTCTLQIW